MEYFPSSLLSRLPPEDPLQVRLGRASLAHESPRSALQAQGDGLVSHFLHDTANPLTLTAMVAGGMAYRIGRIGVMSLRVGAYSNTPLWAASIAVGLGSEVTAFEFTHRTLYTLAGGHAGPPLQNASRLWSWSGPGGWRQGLLSSFVTFGTLRGAGFLAREQNIFFQHAFQSTAMVAGHNATGVLGIAPRTEGNLAEQFLHAEAVNLQMTAGMGVVHGLFPGFMALERNLDLNLRVGAKHSAQWSIGQNASPLRDRGGIFTLQPVAVGSSNLHSSPSSHLSMMSIHDVVSWMAGGRKGRGPAEAPPPDPADAGGSGRGSSSPPPSELMGYFQSLYDPGETLGLRRSPEGETVVIGRETPTQEGLFPDHYRNISRRHLDLRRREGRLEIRSHQGSKEFRINHQEISPFRWYRLRHGDLIEFLGESRFDSEAPELESADPRRPVQPGDRPALFRYLDSTLPSFPLPEVRQLPPPESVPMPSWEVIEELARFSKTVNGVVHLTGQTLRQFPELLSQNPVGAARDLIKAHRHFCGGSWRRRLVYVGQNSQGESINLNIEVPHWEGILAERLRVFEQGLQPVEADLNPVNPIVVNSRQALRAVRDQLLRLHEIVKSYRQILNTPVALTLLEGVEMAYAGLSPESIPRVERVRSPSRSLNIVISEEERQRWSDEFLQGVLEPRLRRNVQILMGRVPEVLGQAVGGSFFRALSLGTLYEGLRNVRGLFDAETGELVAFRDESGSYLETVGRLRQQGRRLDEVSFLVDVIQSGRIQEVSVLDPNVRASVHEGLEGLKNLQVLPSNEGPPSISSGETVHTVFGTTEQNYEDGEIWQMAFPFDPQTPSRELRQVVAVTPLRDSMGPEGVSRFSLVTLEPLAPEEGVDALQLWVPGDLVQGWEAGAVVRVTRRR